jgi:hypothetical protein
LDLDTLGFRISVVEGPSMITHGPPDGIEEE